MELLYLSIAALCVTVTVSVNYRELERMGVSCYPRDTCTRSNGNFRDRSCECERSCVAYNDCCVDGPKPTRSNQLRRLAGMTCVPFLPDQGVYSISTCSGSWNGPENIKHKCEGEIDLSDPLMSVPATLISKKITYRNLHCAVCNNANPSSLTLWNLKMLCNSLLGYNNITEKFIMENIVRVGNSWGVYHWNRRLGRTSFFPCSMTYTLPHLTSSSVRYCRPNVVSTCAANWNRRSVRKDCDSYMGVVYINGQGYRNAHCAQCNYVSVDSAKCLPGDAGIVKTWLSLTLIMDINRADKKDKCPIEKIYDPYLKKCHLLMCSQPGYIVKNKQCVKN